MTAPDTLSASELQARTGVPAATIQYYVRSGLLPRPRRAGYDGRHIEGVRLIRALRARRGLPLPVIGRILPELVGRKDAFRAEAWDELIRRHDTRDHRLLDAAIRTFARLGYAGATVDAIARAAGRAKGSVYRAYPSKADLFFAAASRAGERSRTASGRPSPAALRRHLTIFLDLAAGALRREPGFPAALSRVLGLLGGGAGARTLGSAVDRALRERIRSGRGA